MFIKIIVKKQIYNYPNFSGPALVNLITVQKVSKFMYLLNIWRQSALILCRYEGNLPTLIEQVQ
ncbi:MAG: hypothetical protein AUK59_04685 [Candidatus Altarchaeum sp. CG2_30_32_3053]|nr:MAG: hypothetical protein AUK59_04685 [Candidatus Altarchaeum sp. CG2_30_32_3053]